jgi:GNAT superfamily N-acetyltransferase
LNHASTGGEIEIRLATKADCPSLARLAVQLGYSASAEQIAQRLDAARKSDEHRVLIAQEHTGEIVGWIGLYVFRPITSDARVEISGLIVDEARRSRKVGALLLKSAEQWAISMGLHAIGLHCNVVRERAHGFYERNGYRVAKTQKVFEKKLSS